MKRSFFLSMLLCAGLLSAYGQGGNQDISLSSPKLKVSWAQEKDGWHIKSIVAGGKVLPHPSGLFTLIYLNRKPAPNLVDLDLEGKDFSFYPATATKSADGTITFTQTLRFGVMESKWKIDPNYPTDIMVEMSVKAKLKGSFAVASPTLAVIDPKELSWGMIPGNWYGRELQSDFQLATKYSQGLPNVAFLAKERNTMTLSPMLTTKNKITLAVIPDPGTANDPYVDSVTRGPNKVGMSTMNRHAQLTPVAYSPVLGQAGSMLQVGETTTFKFRYSVQATDWFPVFKHAVNDIYQFAGMLDIQQQKRSLSERVRLMQGYLQNEKKSNWTIQKVKGLEIGANGSKNADVGALCMLAYAGQDAMMQKHLPYVRNYKLVMQEMLPGFFKGASMGEYSDEDGTEAERGNWVEPLFTTYYTLMDMGNMLLFNPNDPELKARVRQAGDKLMLWQHTDGGFDVAYDRESHELSFPDLKDLRPTWYGLLIAYRVTGDQKYLLAAQKGADWLIKNGVDKGHYLGVCGDGRNIWDFATAQCSESLLELYTTTKNERYKKAAIDAAEIYATSIFTQPIATAKIKKINGKDHFDWEVSQTGLSVEHIRGTASGGPILISSFAGLFVRMYELTRNDLFLTMARCAARGRDVYVDPASGQSIYYWNGLEKVETSAKMFPHHAFWQIGWITDYLLSEVKLRSNNKITFPSGFMTPKVGPHVSYGFAPGSIYSATAKLFMPEGLLKSGNPYLEYVAALNEKDHKLYVMVLNQSSKEQTGDVTIDLNKINNGQKGSVTKTGILQGEELTTATNTGNGSLGVKIKPWGMSVITVDFAPGK
jgi:hypothetical protein